MQQSFGRALSKLFLMAILSTYTATVLAAAPNFQNLTADQVKGVMKDFASSMYPTTVTGASSLGTVFGFQVGVIGGASESPTIDSLVSNDVSKMPKGAFIGVVTFPFGLGLEAGLMPVTVGDFEYGYTHIGGRWTITKLLNIPILELKLKFDTVNADIKFKQEVSGVPVNVTYDNKATAYSLTAGINLLVVEPYVGIGRIESKSSLKATGSATIFDSSIPVGANENVKSKDTYTFLGVDVGLLFFKLGAEYAKVYGNSVYTGKLAFGF